MGISKAENLILKVCKIYYSYIENVDVIDDNYDRSVSVTFLLYNTWQELYVSSNTIRYNEDNSQGDAGISYSQKFEATIPGEDTGKLSDLDNLVRHRHIVRLVYDNGVEKLVGNLDNPVIFKLSSSTSGVTSKSVSFSRKSFVQSKIISSDSDSGSGSGS